MKRWSWPLLLSFATVLPAFAQQVFVASDTKKPTRVIKPLYPESAKLAGIEGTVVVDMTIETTGEVQSVKAISGPKELWSAAEDAVKQWTWKPLLLNGKPVRFRTKATINFVLNKSHSPKSSPVSR